METQQKCYYVGGVYYQQYQYIHWGLNQCLCLISENINKLWQGNGESSG